MIGWAETRILLGACMLGCGYLLTVYARGLTGQYFGALFVALGVVTAISGLWDLP